MTFRQGLPIESLFDQGQFSMPLDALLTSIQRRIHLFTTLGTDRLQLMEIKGREQLSRPYGFKLKLRSEAIDIIDLDKLLGTAVRASFQLPNPNWEAVLESDAPVATRDFCGILSRVSYDRSDDRYRYYKALLRPKLWTLGLNQRFRMFSERTTREIVTEVLGDLPTRWALSNDKTHNYCVQYGESDLDFVSRLLEEDGLFYFFEHQYDDQPEDDSQRCERLVITDNIQSANADIPSIHAIDEVEGGMRDSMRIRRWSESRRMTPSQVVSLDRHFQRPDTLVRGDDVVPGSAEGSVDIVTEYPSGLVRRSDNVSPAGSDREQLSVMDLSADNDALMRVQRLQCLSSDYAGTSDVATMMPGGKFGVTRDSIPDAITYYLSAVEHFVRLNPSTYSGGDQQELRYENRFRCHADTVAYRPAKVTPKPRIDGVVPATVVVDPAITDDEVCVDKYGRVKVVFPWQQGSGEPSCWVRVSQFWAGPRWGAFFWPRDGHEVLISFEHGDPDRPVIVGSVYNANNMPPLALPDHKLSCGINSCSHKGNPVENTSCVVFHDKKGDEYLQLHSETFQCMTSETKELKIAAGQSIFFQGHSKIFDLVPSSGGGGSDATGENAQGSGKYKSYNAGEVAVNFIQGLFAADPYGQVDFSFGDGYAKKFGRHFETNVGCKVWLGCDPIELMEKASSNPLLGAGLAAVFGAGGQGKTLVGNTQNINYGIKYDIQRGDAYKNSMCAWNKEPRDGGNFYAWEKTIAKVCFFTAAICLMIDIVFMFLTRMFVDAKPNDWHAATMVCNVWSLMLLPRIQGMLEFFEGLVAQLKTLGCDVEGSLKESVAALEDALRAATTTDAAQEDDVANVKKKIAEVIESIRECLVDVEKLIAP